MFILNHSSHYCSYHSYGDTVRCVMLPEVAAGICSRVFMFTFMILHKKMRGFAISLHFLCFAVVFVGEIHCLYEDQAGLFDW